MSHQNNAIVCPLSTKREGDLWLCSWRWPVVKGWGIKLLNKKQMPNAGKHAHKYHVSGRHRGLVRMPFWKLDIWRFSILSSSGKNPKFLLENEKKNIAFSRTGQISRPKSNFLFFKFYYTFNIVYKD